MAYSYKKLKTWRDEVLREGLKKASENPKTEKEHEEWKKKRFFKRFFSGNK